MVEVGRVLCDVGEGCFMGIIGIWYRMMFGLSCSV